MSKLRVLVAAVAINVCLLAGLAYSADVAVPKIEITPMTYDFGTISDDVKNNATFTIKNTGKADLVIYDVKPTCGCTVANLTSKKIAPGATSRLDAVYDSHNANGQVRRFINIRTNDPVAETVSLGLSAVVNPKPAPEINLSAFQIPNLQMPRGGKEKRTVTVTNPGQMELVIKEITASPGVSAEIGKIEVKPAQTVKTDIKLKPGASAEMNLLISPKNISGNFQELVTIRSNAKRRPAVTVIIQGVVQG
jgi:hypothetical protein